MRSANEELRETVEEGITVSSRFFLLLILGFILFFAGIVVFLIASVLHGSSSVGGGAVIFIGPFPIVIGAGSDVTSIVLFSIILAVLSIMVLLVLNRKIRRFEG